MLENDDDIQSADIFLIPPNDCIDLERDSDDEDVASSINHLSGCQLLTEASARVLRNYGKVTLINGDDNGTYKVTLEENEERVDTRGRQRKQKKSRKAEVKTMKVTEKRKGAKKRKQSVDRFEDDKKDEDCDKRVAQEADKVN